MGSGSKVKNHSKELNFYLFTFTFFLIIFASPVFCQEVKKPNVAGAFYPQDPEVLSEKITSFLEQTVDLPVIEAPISGIIVPHAGYEYSGKVAAFAYKLIENQPYTTVVILAASHHFGFKGAVVYPSGSFRTPLGDAVIDTGFINQMRAAGAEIGENKEFFEKEHSLEVQIPFLQATLKNFKIVPVLMGDCSFADIESLAENINHARGDRKDVLLVASTDMYHGYDFEEAVRVDLLTNTYLLNFDPAGLYKALKEQSVQLCGGMPVVTLLQAARSSGGSKAVLLKQTNSAEVTKVKKKGVWTVGYSSWVVTKTEGAAAMLNQDQRKKILMIARSSIETYLQTGKKIKLSEEDPALLKPMGAFVTLRKHGELRGCIGSLVGSKPLYLTIAEMAVESATGDPRFAQLSLNELRDVEIEISVLSPLEKVPSADGIILGKHGVIVKKGFRSGVFLPQVADETKWSKEEFLNNLCAHKAGLPEDAWKDKNTELYIFTAEVFSE